MWEKRTQVHCWWECKLVQPLWKTIMEFPQKTKNGTVFGPSDSSAGNILSESQNTNTKELQTHCIYFCSDLYYITLSTHFGLCCSFSSSFKCERRLFELFLFWNRPVMLWISLLVLFSQCPTNFCILSHHFHLFQGILISSLISLTYSLITHYLASMSLYVFPCSCDF